MLRNQYLHAVPPALAAVVLGTVADLYGVSPAVLTGPTRGPGYLPEARRIAMTLLWERGYTSTAIGRTVGREHSTVLHHVHRMEAGMSAEEAESLQMARRSVKDACAEGKEQAGMTEEPRTHYAPYRGHAREDDVPCQHCGQLERQHWDDGACFTVAELGERLRRRDFAPRPSASGRRET